MWCLVYSKPSVLRDLSVYTTPPSTCQMFPISESLVLSLLIHHPERQTVWNTMGIPKGISSSTWRAVTKCFLRFKLFLNIGTCLFLRVLFPPLRMESSTSHNTHLFKCVPCGARDLVYCSRLVSMHEALDLTPNRKERSMDNSVLSPYAEAVVRKCFPIFIWTFLYVLEPMVGQVSVLPPLSEVRWYSNWDKVRTFK